MKHFAFDLDNTLIDFSQSSIEYARKIGLSHCENLNALRRILKPGDEESAEWTRAQSWIYGEGLHYANVSPYALKLIENLSIRKWKLSIISHKTEFGPVAFGKIPFRKLALEWLSNSTLHNYFSHNNNIWFANSLNDKVAIISKIMPDFYVDDLLKVFLHNNYPDEITSFLYKSKENTPSWINKIESFQEIYDCF